MYIFIYKRMYEFINVHMHAHICFHEIHIKYVSVYAIVYAHMYMYIYSLYTYVHYIYNVYSYMNIYLCTHIYVICIHGYKYIYMYTYVCVCIYVCIYVIYHVPIETMRVRNHRLIEAVEVHSINYVTCAYTTTYARLRMQLLRKHASTHSRTYTHSHKHTHTHKHTYTRGCTHTHAHTHTPTHTQSRKAVDDAR